MSHPPKSLFRARDVREGSGRSRADSHDGADGADDTRVADLSMEEWPEIGQGIQGIRGAPRRLTLVPQRFSGWCVDSSGYRPSTRGGQRLIRDQIADDIKRHLFVGQGGDEDMRELAAASNRLEQSMEKLLTLSSPQGRKESVVPAAQTEEEDDTI